LTFDPESGIFIVKQAYGLQSGIIPKRLYSLIEGLGNKQIAT
jgi:hypothetical protein